MKEWEIKKLSEICHFVRGPFGGSLKKDIFKQDGYAVYEQQHAIYNQFSSIRYFIDTKKFDEMKRFEIKPGDLIMSCSGTMGKVAIVPEQIKPGIINQALLKLTPTRKVLNKYLKIWLQSESFQESLKAFSLGAAIQNVASVSILKNIQIPLPPLSEQKRIVSILDEAFAAIDNANANAEKNLKNTKELFESYLQSVFENKGEGWEEKKLNTTFNIKPPKKEAKENLNEDDSVSFIPMEDLGILMKNVLGKKERKLKEVQGSYTYFADNDVLMAKITPCFENGKLGIARNLRNGIGFGSSEFIVFRSNGNVVPDFLFYFLSQNLIRNVGSKLMTGAVGHKRVSKDWVENYKISYPISIHEQEIIVQKLDTLSERTKYLEYTYHKKIESLDELKKSLLQKAFSGELTAKEPITV
ncbi:hypothetical protein BH23BAC1_BH23BAC1_50350 [soil metagenome]